MKNTSSSSYGHELIFTDAVLARKISFLSRWTNYFISWGWTKESVKLFRLDTVKLEYEENNIFND